MAADGHLNFDTKVDTKGYESGLDKVEKYLNELLGELNNISSAITDIPNVDIKADTSQIRGAEAEIAAIGDGSAEVDVSADTAEANAALAETAEKAESVPGEVEVEIKPDADTVPITDTEAAIGEVGDKAEETAEEVSKSFKKAGRNANSEVNGSCDSMLKALSGTLGKVKSLVAAAGLAFGVKEVITFGKEAVESAAAVNAANSQLAQTFGSMQQTAEDAIKRVADQSGILETRLRSTGTSIYAFAKTSGMDSAQALGMMEEALQVAADSAAYYDRSLEDTSETLKSFLKGNYANDAALGLSATETTRNAAANRLYGKSFQELSEAQKQLTLLQMVKDANALSGAEGQAAREADGWENVLGNLKEAWRQLLAVVGQPVLQIATNAVKQLTSALTYLTQKAQTAISALSQLFGWELGSTAAVTDNITESVTSQEELTDAVEGTAKAQQKSLAGFDKINKLSSDSADSTGSSGGGAGTNLIPATTSVGVDTSGASKKLSSFVKETKRIFGQLSGWIDKNFSPTFDDIWSGLVGETFELYGTMQRIFGDISSLAPPLLDFFKGDFTTQLQTVFAVWGGIAVGLFDTFNTVFADLWSLAVFPALTDFIELGLPMISQFCTEMNLSLGTLFEEVKGIFDMLWTDAAEPVLTEISVIWHDLMTEMSDFWNKWGSPIFEAFRNAIKNTGDTLKNIWNTILKPVFDKLMTTFDDIWSKHIKPLVRNFLDFVGTLIDGALKIYNEFILPIVNWFVDKFGPPIVKIFNWIVEVVGKVIGNIIDFVSDIVRVLKGIVNFIVGVFTGDWEQAWNGIKDIFKGVWDALVDIVKAPINLIIGLINGLLDGVESGLNWIIDGINSISIDTPGWLEDLTGISSFGFNLSNVDLPEIPYLAKGTVIPANYGNFLAMLGDNKRETEVVSPLSTIEKALENVLSRRSAGGPETIHVHVDLDGREIGHVAVKAVNEDNARKGR